MKTKEELNTLKQECEILTSKLIELSEDELKEVFGGNNENLEKVFTKYALFPRLEVCDNLNQNILKGQQQRVVIARALNKDLELLCVDETQKANN